MNLSTITQEAVMIIQEAGDLILSYYQDAFSVTDKAPGNPVTDADLAADRLLRQKLLALLPEAGWLSEETVDQPDRLQKKYVWVVDPLDGTKEFVMGKPEFAVSVALVEDGQPIIGIILNPPTKELYVGIKGQGIQLNGRSVQCTPRTELKGATIDASRSEMKRNEFSPFASFLTLQIMGSIAYKLARVAAGQVDATWSRGPKNEWDICAGVLLLQEAGGFAVNLDNQPFTFNNPRTLVNGIIVGPHPLHSEIISTLAPYRETART